MAAATRTRPGNQPKVQIVYYQHLEGGAVHGYDKAFLEGAFAFLNLPPHLKAQQKRKHPLVEIALQIRRRVLVPVQAPAPSQINTVQIDPQVVDEILAKERELARERKLAALEAARERLMAGEDVDLTPYLDDSPYMAARPAVVVPEPREREPRLAVGMVDGVEPEFTPDGMVSDGLSFPGGDDEEFTPFGDVPAGGSEDVVSLDRPMAAEPAGDTTTPRPRRGTRRKE
ncbi:MAG: hypothetical protein ACRDRN_10340 [Sciscionella sp.]